MNIDELRKYFSGLNFQQKKEFILNLKTKLEGTKNGAYHALLEECVRTYNEEVRARNEKAGFPPREKPTLPDISADTFARALATMIHGRSARPSLVGKWQRDPEDGDFYYKFNEDGTFSTNEFTDAPPNGILVGNYSVGIDGVVLMEPHEKLVFTGLMFSQAGDSLIITLKDGLMFEYRRV